MVNNPNVNKLVNAGGTLSLAGIVYFLLNEFGNLSSEYQLVVFFGSVVLVVAIAYGSAYIKKMWGIDPSDIIKELTEILEVLQGVNENMPQSATPVDDSKLKVTDAYNRWKGLKGVNAVTSASYDSKILPEIKAAGITPELLVNVFPPQN